MNFLETLWLLKLLKVTAVLCQKVATFQRVDVPLPNSASNCFLLTIPKNLSVIRCIAACTNYPGCTVACISPNKCSLYNAVVSKNYDHNGSGFVTTNVLEITSECFSAWPFENDIINEATLAVSSVYPNYYATYVHDGWFCVGDNLFWGSGAVPNPWIEFAFSTPRKIKRVIIVVHTSLSFTVNFGNVSGVGNHQVYHTLSGNGAKFINFNLENNVVAMYVSVVCNGYGFVDIAEAAIMEE